MKGKHANNSLYVFIFIPLFSQKLLFMNLKMENVRNIGPEKIKHLSYMQATRVRTRHPIWSKSTVRNDSYIQNQECSLSIARCGPRSGFWATPDDAQGFLLTVFRNRFSLVGPYGMWGNQTTVCPRLVHVRQMPYRLHHCFGPLLFIFQMNIITYFW